MESSPARQVVLAVVQLAVAEIPEVALAAEVARARAEQAVVVD